MSDRERLLEALRGAGERGVHTFDIRRSGISGNPSERIRELRALGHTIRGEREKVGERWGKRFYLEVDVGREAIAANPGRGLSSGGVSSLSPPDAARRLFDPPSRWDELQKA